MVKAGNKEVASAQVSCVLAKYFFSPRINESIAFSKVKIRIWFDGAETNCGIARILGILLMNSYDN